MIQTKNGMLSNPMYFDTSIEMLDRAHSLRLNYTDSEDMLWQIVRNRQIGGLKFRRQHALGKFVADFYCHEAQLILEVDGGIHLSASQKEKDSDKTFELESIGLKIIRFTNNEVKFKQDIVKNKILDFIKQKNVKI